ncbi:RNA polymerase sigma factor [Roseovarius sp. EL26]|uniref:RNA polymerase sigma factor n=1 Tax=Roseovarius sp. EL26 TaxID=2126672 RepID=UPI000EA34E7B|nr:RNA polymerase sigma factor [Roseovarius sp. EL26]
MDFYRFAAGHVLAKDLSLTAIEGLSDGALLVLFANGDQQAARVLTLRLTPAVLGHAMRLLGDRAEAEDVAQEAMLRLWRIAPQWQQDQAKVTTWLYRVVANLCTDRLRKMRPMTLDAVDEPVDETASTAEQIQDQIRAQALQQALNDLPERQRQAVVLRHIEGLSNPEIAEIMEISIEAVESLNARGRRSLSVKLSEKREELGYVDAH